MHCLRTWLERQQTCPTCRMSVLAPGRNAQGGQQRGAAARPGAEAAAGVRINVQFGTLPRALS